MEILNEQPAHVEFLESQEYKKVGNIRYWRKGGVFIAFNKSLTKCTILRAHPLRKDTMGRKSQFNVVYRGLNPWDDMEFAQGLWRHVGLHRDFRKKEVDLNVDDVLSDLDLLLKF